MFRKYFLVCSISVFVSIIVLGAILLGVASRFFQETKYDMMERFLGQAAIITAENYAGNKKTFVDSNLIGATYSVVSITINADVFLVDLSGRIVHHADSGVQGNGLAGSGEAISPETIRVILDAGLYETTGTLGGFFVEPQHIVGVPVRADGEDYGVVLASSSARDMVGYIRELTKIFVVSAIVVLALVSAIIYLITARLVKPLQSMLDATHSFSRGDFSKRVPVPGYDEIGRLAMAFNNMASTLATTENTRRSFVANVSHELKTPMTTIGGFVDGILDGTIPDEKREQYLLVVSNECKRLTRLVHSMLDTAQLETGEMELRPVIFDISESIRQIIFTFEHAIEDKGLEVLGLEEDHIMVLADVDLMHQVVYNLIDNAVKFANPGGYIQFLYRVETDAVYVTVRNSGEGVSREEAGRLFDRFYKSDRSRSRDKEGVGLGLYIVRSILLYHKGDIEVTSKPKQYTDFTFSLPNLPKTDR